MPDDDRYVLLWYANPDAVVYPEYADSYVGMVDGPEGEVVAVYDRGRVIETVARRDGVDFETARDFVDYNLTSLRGPDLPVWVDVSPSYVRDWLVPLRFLDVTEEGEPL